MKHELIIDLPIINRPKYGLNVEYKGHNVYIGNHSADPSGTFILIVLASDNMETPVYRGGFQDMYPKKGQKLSEMFESYGVWGVDRK